MMLDKVIEPDSLRATAHGFNLGLRLPWYRALPLSTIDIDEVQIDGEPIPHAAMRLELNGSSWSLPELGNATDEFWWVPDTATLDIAADGLEPGRSYDVLVTLSLYPPYIRGLRRAVRWTRTMEMQS